MKSRMRMLVGVGIAALLLVVAAGAGAWGAGETSSPRVSPLVGRAFRISGPQATDGEIHPAVAWNGTAQEFLVVWADGRNSPTSADIYGRRVSAAGSAVGPDFRISGPRAVGLGEKRAVVWNGTANEYLVVWEDYRNSMTRNSDIYGRRVSAAGTPVGADFRISGAGAIWDDWWPSVAWDATANEYLVVWADMRNSSTRGLDIYGRRVSAAGAPVGADFRISGRNATFDESWPSVAWGGTANQFLVVWGDRRNQITGESVYGRRVSAAGTPVGADFRIDGPDAMPLWPAPVVAYDSTADQFLVVWIDGRDISTSGSDIYGRRVSAAGTPLGADLRISNAIPYEDTPTVAYDSAASQFLVVWQDCRNCTDSTYNPDIYGRRVSAAGTPLGAGFRIGGSSFEDAFPAVAYDPTSNQFLVVWQDARNISTRGDDIYGRRVAG